MKSWEEIKVIPRIAWQNITEDGAAGLITVPSKWTGTIIASTGAGWEHVSVSPIKKRIIPSWEDMCFIKDLFWNEDESVIQIHPAKSDYVNNMPNCLHLWRCSYKDMVLPPRVLVGVVKGMTSSQIEKEIKEAFAAAGEEF